MRIMFPANLSNIFIKHRICSQNFAWFPGFALSGGPVSDRTAMLPLMYSRHVFYNLLFLTLPRKIETMNPSDWQSRTRLLLGEEKLNKLHASNVLVAGLGGVGAYAAEQLVRAGIGRITIVDGDRVHHTNRNRQLPALISTHHMPKTMVMAQRLTDINPEVRLTTIQEYIKDERMIEILEQGYDYVIDAIDTLSPKVYLIYHTLRLGMPLVSSMGAGGKFDPMQVRISDISATNNCKLAYYMRKRLHKLGIWEGFKAVWSPEEVSRNAVELSEGEINKKSTVGTISYMPAIFGCFCAAAVIQDITKFPSDEPTQPSGQILTGI